ncbi:hypothetical protein [Streptomyces cacaoi]|uniref:hypothetical protein n=1 Tax=Streptomyces cacaoi TaxID=1898 RepID=UPI00374877B1
MSNSRQKRAARIRMSYTGECYEAALSGISRDFDHGLDACTPEQREFRALLALGFLNRGPIAARLLGGWGVSELSAYTITMSPRWKRLALITDVPHNVAGRIVQEDSSMRFPGLRMEQHTGYGSYLLRHMPTGAEMVVTDNASGVPSKGPDSESYLRPWTTDVQLRSAELDSLKAIPAMTENTQLLLAGIAVRFSAHDAKRKWAIGNWHWDPLQRPRNRERGYDLFAPEIQRRLWGEGDYWELTWAGYPYPADLAASLTDSAIGVKGAKLSRYRETYEVTLGDTILSIRGWRS